MKTVSDKVAYLSLGGVFFLALGSIIVANVMLKNQDSLLASPQASNVARTAPTTTVSATWPEYFSTSKNELPTWAKTSRKTVSVDGAISFTESADVILTMGQAVCGALGSGRSQEDVDAFMSGIRADNGATYRDCIKNEAVKGTKGQMNDHSIYWHLGNEVNSKHFSETMGTTGRSFDQAMIADFVEYFIAPTVQGLNEAQVEAGSPVRTVLGSIVSGHNADSREWLDTVLEYTIVGTNAPELAGKHVYEIVDFISFHYTIGADTWEESFDDIAKWIGTGKIRGIIDTEELGAQAMARGAAQFQAIQGFSRFMTWANDHRYTPRQARLNFWAHEDYTPDAAMQLIYNFLGDTVLKNSPLPTLDGEDGDSDKYAFTTTNNNKRLYSVLTGPQTTTSWETFQIPAGDWEDTVSGTLYVFKVGSAEYTETHISAEPKNGFYTIDVPVSLGTEGTALLMLENVSITVAEPPVVIDNPTTPPTPTPTPVPVDTPATFSKGSVGYLGCSMTVNAVEGYQSEGGDVLWGGKPGDFGGGSITVWAGLVSTSPFYWKGFDSLLAANPGTNAVWIELCTSIKKGDANDTYANTLKIRDEILKRIPNASIYVSAQPTYTDGHVCGIAGADGPAKMQAIADQLVSNGLAKAGPVLGPLSTTQIADGCHANTSGKSLMGAQIVEFFGH